jgi:hypothetical protein
LNEIWWELLRKNGAKVKANVKEHLKMEGAQNGNSMKTITKWLLG